MDGYNFLIVKFILKVEWRMKTLGDLLPEDKERYHRFTMMGYVVKRIDQFIYHLEHSRGRNSWPTSIEGNPYMRENFALWTTLQKMSKQQLLEYYSNQEYLKNYL